MNTLAKLFAAALLLLHSTAAFGAAGQITPIGRQPAADSQAVVISNEDSAQVAAILAQLQASLAVTQSGAWNIGSVATLPAISLAAGSNVIGAVTGTFWQATQPVSGTFWQSTQPVSVTTLPSITIGAAIPAGSNVIGGVTQSGSWTISLPAGAATAANQATEITSLASIATNTGLLGSGLTISTLPALPAGSNVIGGVTGTFWQATQPVSGTFWQTTQPVSGTFFQTTQPVSAASLPLPAGATTSALQVAGNASLASLASGVTVISLPSVTIGAALPVGSNVIGGVTQSGSWTISLPAGAATAANQATEITSLASIATNTGLLGSGLTISTLPALPAGSNTIGGVTGTFWQATQPVSVATLPSITIGAALPAGSNVIGAVTESGTFLVGGDVGPQVADAGNPVKVGAVYNSTRLLLNPGQRGNMTLDQYGSLNVQLMNGSGSATGASAFANPNQWDGTNATNANSALPTTAIMVAQTGTNSTNIVRVANLVFAVSTAATGNTAIWSPSGKKFRLMGYTISFTSNCAQATAGVLTAKLYDGSSTFLGQQASAYVPGTAVTTGPIGGFTTGAVQLGNGYLSVSASNPLYIQLSSALTSGACIVNVWGAAE
jgi:hypothetical protein